MGNTSILCNLKLGYFLNMKKNLFTVFLFFTIVSAQSYSFSDEPKGSLGSTSNPTSNKRCIGGAIFENEFIDCAGARIGLSCKGDDEHQPAVLTLKNASVKNLIIAADGGSDGIKCVSGDCVLENVVWEDICEDAASLIKSGKSMTIRGGSVFNSLEGVGGKPDKIFQHNAGTGSTFTITGGFVAKGVNGKLWKSCGNCKNNSGPRHLIIDNVRIEGKIHAISALNVNAPYNDTVTISNLSIENYRPKKTKICKTFFGSTRENGKKRAKPLIEEWETKNCQVSKSDVTSF